MQKAIIVDDNYPFVEQLYNYLYQEKPENIEIVRIFSDGKQALDYLSKNSIQILLVDLNLPKLNGIELIEEVHKLNQDIHIIVMSGYFHLIKTLKSKNIPIDSYLLKPFNMKELMTVLKTIQQTPHTQIDIMQLLDHFYFNKNHIGYFYIIDCLEFCLENHYASMPSSKIVYQYIAEKHGYNNYLKIGWNIDKCIKIMYELTSDEVKQKFFHNALVPSTKHFINAMLRILNAQKSSLFL